MPSIHLSSTSPDWYFAGGDIIGGFKKMRIQIKCYNDYGGGFWVFTQFYSRTLTFISMLKVYDSRLLLRLPKSISLNYKKVCV
jgi:hypothetical protein